MDRIPAHLSAAIVTIFVVTILAFGPPDRVTPVLNLFETITGPISQNSTCMRTGWPAVWSGSIAG